MRDRHAAAFDREAWAKRKNEVHARIAVSRVVGAVVSLKPASGEEYKGLCPFHDERSPSFTVNDKKGFYYCFGCGAHGDAIAFVQQRQGLDFKAAVELLESENGLRHLERAAPVPVKPKTPQTDDEKKARKIAEIWKESRHHEAVDQYLRGRAIIPPASYGIGDHAVNRGWPSDLMFHPSCWHGKVKRALPAMIAPYRGADGEIVAIHRTYLQRVTGGWTKAGTGDDKMHYGRRQGAIIQLCDPSDRMLGGEGIETTLSAMQLFRRAGVAFGSADAMVKIEPPFVCSDFLYAADWNRKNRTGEKAAWAGAKAHAHGRIVSVKVPNLRDLDKADFNDVLQRRRSGEAA